MTSIPGNLFLLGIVISILFFYLGARSFRFKKQWFEGAIYFIISASSTCLLARMALNPVTFGNSELVIDSARSCWAIAIIGLFIGWFAPFRMLVYRKLSYNSIMKSVFLVLLFLVYMYLVPGLLYTFETISEGTVDAIVGMNYGFSVFVLLHFIAMIARALAGLYDSKKADKTKENSNIKPEAENIDPKKESEEKS